MAILAESSWFSSVSPSKCSVSHSHTPRLSWYLQLIKRRQINQEELSRLAVGFSLWRSAFFLRESLVGFVVDHVALNKFFLPVLQFKLGSHYSTETPLLLSPRARKVVPFSGRSAKRLCLTPNSKTDGKLQCH